MAHMPLNVFIYRRGEQDNPNMEETVKISSVNVPIVPLQEGPYDLREAQEPSG